MDDDAEAASVGLGNSPAPSRQPWRPPTIVAAVVLVAVVVGTSCWAAGDDDYESSDRGSGACSVSNPSDAVDPADVPTVRHVLPAGPVLEWKQVQPPVDEFYSTSAATFELTDDADPPTIGEMLDAVTVESYGLRSGFTTLGEGRVLVRMNDGGRERLLVTSNGRDWDLLPIPEHIYPQVVAYSDGRWAIAGPAFDGDFDRSDLSNPALVVTSTDEGAAWTDVPLRPPTESLFWDGAVLATDLMVSRDRIVLISSLPLVIRPNDPRILRHLAGIEYEHLVGLLITDGTVTALVVTSDPGGDTTRRSVPLEGLELTEREQRLLGDRDVLLGDPPSYVRVYAGDQSGLDVTAEIPGWGYGVAAEALLLAVNQDNSDSWRFLASEDGRRWDEVYSASSRQRNPLVGVDRDGQALALISGGDGREILMTMACGMSPVPVAAFEPFSAGIRAFSPWSPDGRMLSLHNLNATLGGEVSQTDVAVGRGFVLASVRGRGDPAWFMAEVP